MPPTPLRPRLIADIGGTNARFALTGADGRPYGERVLAVADYDGITAATRAYLADCPEPRPLEAVLAVALPITGDQVTMTNNTRWSFSIEATRRALGFEQLQVLNDFTALALAVPHLTPGERRQVGGGNAVPGTAIALLGPGTGLGMAGLIWAGNRWLPLQSEGGHATFAPITDREWAIVRWWREQRLQQQKPGHISCERLVSGPGLVNLYQALAALAQQPADALQPSQITERALADACPLCREAVDMFCAALGSAAGNLALTLGALGGVYIGGGIVPRLGECFDRSAFRQRFEGKGRFQSYLAAIPTYVITATHPALRGAAAAGVQGVGLEAV